MIFVVQTRMEDGQNESNVEKERNRADEDRRKRQTSSKRFAFVNEPNDKCSDVRQMSDEKRNETEEKQVEFRMEKKQIAEPRTNECDDEKRSFQRQMLRIAVEQKNHQKNRHEQRFADPDEQIILLDFRIDVDQKD